MSDWQLDKRELDAHITRGDDDQDEPYDQDDGGLTSVVLGVWMREGVRLEVNTSAIGDGGTVSHYGTIDGYDARGLILHQHMRLAGDKRQQRNILIPWSSVNHITESWRDEIGE